MDFLREQNLNVSVHFLAELRHPDMHRLIGRIWLNLTKKMGERAKICGCSAKDVFESGQLLLRPSPTGKEIGRVNWRLN